VSLQVQVQVRAFAISLVKCGGASILTRVRTTILLVLCSLLIACGGAGNQPTPQTATASTIQTATPPKQLNTVVFLGDSLTLMWDLPTYFPGQQYTSKGIGGNTTGQMLARFDTDVVALHPDAVMIWGGTNNISIGPIELVEEDLQAMYEKARAAGIVPIACTVTPRRLNLASSNPYIVQVNTWIRGYGAAHGITVADYYPVVVDSNGELRSDFALDGVHFNAAGYSAISPVAAQAIGAAR
jgi:lysophospholipase L1-like esterase